MHVRSLAAKIVEIAYTGVAGIGYDIAVVDGGFVGASGDVTIEHAGKYHGLAVAAGSGYVVVAYDAAHAVASGDVGIAVTVDHACLAVE